MTTCMKTQKIVHYQNGDLAHIILFGIGDISQVDMYMYTVHGHTCSFKTAQNIIFYHSLQLSTSHIDIIHGHTVVHWLSSLMVNLLFVIAIFNNRVPLIKTFLYHVQSPVQVYFFIHPWKF